MGVSVFDIDGVLTKQKGIDKFREAKASGNTVGIISARSQQSINKFVEDAGIIPDFTKSSQFKGQSLMRVKMEYGEDVTYYGSWARDRVHSFVADVNYVQL